MSNTCRFDLCVKEKMLAIALPVLATVVVFVVIWLLWSGVKALHRKLSRKNNTETSSTQVG